MAFSAKTALAALSALGIALWVGLPMPFWAMTTAYFVSTPLSGATRSKAIYRVAGTFIGAGVAVGLVPMLVGWPELLSVAIALWVGGTLAVSLLDRSPRAYVLMLSGYTAAIVAFPAVDRPETVFDVATARVTEIVLGITCATLAHSLFWPRSVGAALGLRIRNWLADAQHWHGDIRDGAGPDATARDREQLAADAVDCALLATHIPFDTSHWREATAQVQALLPRMLLLLPVLSGMADRRAALGGGSDAWANLLAESYELRDAQARQLLDECGQLLTHLEDPSATSPLPSIGSADTLKLHADPAFAALSGAAATLAILLCCALWIGTGWADGGVAAALTGVFCCLFAGLDNPVPTILRFGVAILAGIPLAGFYLFAVLPGIDGFALLAAVLMVPLLAIGSLMTHPRWGVSALATMAGFCSAMAIQETYNADFARFLNSNLAQVVAVVLAAGVTAGLRTISTDTAIARLNRHMRRDLVALASAARPPDPLAALGRSADQLALITQRLGAETTSTVTGLTEVRIAMNIVNIHHLRAAAPTPLHGVLGTILRETAAWFARPSGDDAPPPSLLSAIDTALRLMLGQPAEMNAGQLLFAGPEPGRAALVALRRNLFPQGPAFVVQAIHEGASA